MNDEFPQITRVMEQVFPMITLKTPLKTQSMAYDLKTRIFKPNRV